MYWHYFYGSFEWFGFDYSKLTKVIKNSII